MHAVLLAGGVGSRLRPYTVTVPKPLLPLGDVPIIEVLVRQLAHQGFTRVTIAVGHLAGLIEAFCGDGSRWGIAIDYVVEEKPLGTAGALALVPEPAADRLLVVNGDTLTDLDMGEACRAHDPADAMTVVAGRREIELEFGVVETDGDRLTGYDEKPALSFLAGVGVYVISTWAVTACLHGPERIDMPDLILRLREAGHPVRVEATDAFWLDLGRGSDLEAAASLFAADPGRFVPG